MRIIFVAASLAVALLGNAALADETNGTKRPLLVGETDGTKRPLPVAA